MGCCHVSFRLCVSVLSTAQNSRECLDLSSEFVQKLFGELSQLAYGFVGIVVTEFDESCDSPRYSGYRFGHDRPFLVGTSTCLSPQMRKLIATIPYLS